MQAVWRENMFMCFVWNVYVWYRILEFQLIGGAGAGSHLMEDGGPDVNEGNVLASFK
jgi:hypothetical protein